MRAYRVIKFQPGGVHKAVVTLCGSGFFCAGVVKHEGGRRDGVAKCYPIRQKLSPTSGGRYARFLAHLSVLLIIRHKWRKHAHICACSPACWGKSFAVSCESRCIFLQRGTLLYHSTTYGRKNIARSGYVAACCDGRGQTVPIS